MEQDKLSYRSVSYIHRVLSHSFKDAVIAKKMKSNPTENTLMKRNHEEEMQEAAAKNDFVARYLNISGEGYRINRTLEIGEILLFLNWLKAKSHRAYLPAILTVGLGGLRRGELLAATWSQIFFDDRRFVVARSLSLTKEAGLQVNSPKTAASIRVVPIPETLISILKQTRIKQLETKLNLGGNYNSNDLIVCLDNGNFITPSSFTHMWSKATEDFSKETGIKKFTHHALRSSIASFYKANGFNDLVAAKSLGHNDPNVTREFYLRPLESELNKAVMILDEQLRKLG
jgi:integrase